MQVYEKYVNLARDAFSSGDRIAAESYQQYAEHYYRIINDTTDPQRPAPQTAGAAGSERAGAEPAEGEQGSPEGGGRERQKSKRDPYPMDAEQPFVDGAAKSGSSTPAAPAAAEGNGQAPETESASVPASDSDGEPPTDGDATKAAPAEVATPNPCEGEQRRVCQRRCRRVRRTGFRRARQGRRTKRLTPVRALNRLRGLRRLRAPD
jgi:hypothetical protein